MVCRLWSKLTKLIKIRIIILLEAKSVFIPTTISFGMALQVDKFDDFPYDLVCSIVLCTFHHSSALLSDIISRAELLYGRKVYLERHSAIINGNCRLNLYPLLERFQHVYIHEPFDIFTKLLPVSCRSLTLMNLQRELDFDSIDRLCNLTELKLSSITGRFSNGEGYYRTICLLNIKNIPMLKRLTLEGPWFQDLIDSRLLLYDFLTSLVNLEYLVAGKWFDNNRF
jgi:hypothetical protein